MYCLVVTTAETLLADVYLTMSGYPLKQDFYRQAADWAREVISSGKYPAANFTKGEKTITFRDVVGTTNPWGAAFEEKHLLLPISQNKLSKNTLLEQNPGYK